MDIDLQEIFRVLNEIMPYLAQQKMRTDFERNRIQMQIQKEMEIMGRRAGYREEEQLRARDIARGLETLGMMTESVKGLARPELELRRRAPLSGIETGLPPYDPEQAEREMAPTESLMQHMAKTLEERKFMLPEKIALATRILPLKTITERPLEIEKARAGREAREITREKTKLGWAELAAKKKGELPEKELKKKLDKLINRRDKARGSWDEEGEQKLTKQINALYKKLGEKSEKDYENLAENLRTKGYTIEKIKETPGMVKDIERQGFEIWILAGYL